MQSDSSLLKMNSETCEIRICLEVPCATLSFPSKGRQAPGMPAACQAVVALQRVTVTSAGEHMAKAANPDGDNGEEQISCLIKVFPVIRETAEEKHC